MEKKVLGILILLSFSGYILYSEASYLFPKYSLDGSYAYTMQSKAGGDGQANEIINWINIDDAISAHVTDLRYNTNDERIAVLDSGLDRATWEYYNDIYGNWVDLGLIDEDGDTVTITNAFDDHNNHHGTTITSLMVQLLECYTNIEIGITVFAIGSTSPSADLIEDQLQRIITWNNQHSTGKYKVISMSFVTPSNAYRDEIETLVNNQKCIVVSASGNAWSTGRLNTTEAHAIENKYLFPARKKHVFGVGGIFGYDSITYQKYRMSTMRPVHSDDIYWGSCYWDDEGLLKSTVFAVAPGFEVDLICDYNEDGQITSSDYRQYTGTSYSAPQVAVAAYLTSRLRYKMDPYDTLTRDDFFACIMNSCENDPAGRTDPDKTHWEIVKKPIHNLGTYRVFFSYRVGYGSLDVYDMLEFITDLS